MINISIHTWTGYIGYSKRCCDTLKFLLNTFCIGCHTPDDVGGCHRCEIGRTNLMMLNYLNDEAKYDKNIDKKKLKILNNIVKNEEEFYCFLRFCNGFEPAKPSEKYMDIIKKEHSGKTFTTLHKHWAIISEGRDKALKLIDEVYKNAPK